MGRRSRWVLITLGVLVFLFFAQRVVFPGEGGSERLGFQALLAEIERRQIERVTLDSWNDKAAVQLAGRPIPLDVDYPDGYEERLVESLLRAGITLEIEERPSALEPLLYYLPFAAFWIWLARRLPRRPSEKTPASA
jgi:hypothetical protein